MTTTITITPRDFGNIAAKAMTHGCDVTTFLIRTALQTTDNQPATDTTQNTSNPITEK